MLIRVYWKQQPTLNMVTTPRILCVAGRMRLRFFLTALAWPLLCSMHHLHTLLETTTMHSAFMATITALSSVRSFSFTIALNTGMYDQQRPLRVNCHRRQICQYAPHRQSPPTQYLLLLAINQTHSRIHMPVAVLI